MTENLSLETEINLRGSAGTQDPKLLWHVSLGDGPVVGVATHAGHEMRPELLSQLAIDEATRIREEDPYTDFWTLACHSQIVARRSRFEIDLNRPLEEAICVQPEDCWNLKVWDAPIGQAAMERSRAEHRAFYDMFEEVLRRIERRYGKFVIYDIHSFNHRRAGPHAAPADPAANPEVNVGTGTLDRSRWGPLVDQFITDLREFDFVGDHLDVRENVNFRGRHLAEFVHRTFPENGCVLAVEVKKFFMDEWTGVGSPEHINAMLEALRATIPGVVSALDRI